MRGAVVGLCALALMLPLVGCGDGSSQLFASSPAPDGERPEPPVRPDSSSSTRPERSPTRRGGRTTVEIGTAVFWERFEIRLGRATFFPSGYGDSGELVVTATFVNHSLDRAMLDLADVTLVQGTSKFPAGLSTVPVLEAGTTGGGTLGFWLPAGFDRAAATLAFGTDDTNQSLVPLSQPSSAVTLAPQPLALRGQGRTTDVRVSVTGGQLSPSYRASERGLGLLRLRFDVAYSGSDPFGLVLDSSDFVLVLPDATEVVGASVASDDLALEIVPPSGQLTGQDVTFRVPLPFLGRYEVRYLAPAGDVATIVLHVE